MKRVILIGDSIRMGYQKYVQAALAGRAEIYGPEENGGTSRNVLKHLDEWAGSGTPRSKAACGCILRGTPPLSSSGKPDIVHINCGLHDLAKDFGSATSRVPLKEYESNVREILSRALKGIEGTVIWATTTPVNEEWHRTHKKFARMENDVVAYNEAASRIARSLKIPINDLFGVITAAGRDKCLGPDGVHFGDDAYALLGKTVADFIRPHLDRP